MTRAGGIGKQKPPVKEKCTSSLNVTLANYRRLPFAVCCSRSYIVYQTVICMKIDTDLLKMLSALVVAVFLAVPHWKKKYFSKKRMQSIPNDKEDGIGA